MRLNCDVGHIRASIPWACERPVSAGSVNLNLCNDLLGLNTENQLPDKKSILPYMSIIFSNMHDIDRSLHLIRCTALYEIDTAENSKQLQGEKKFVPV